MQMPFDPAGPVWDSAGASPTEKAGVTWPLEHLQARQLPGGVLSEESREQSRRGALCVGKGCRARDSAFCMIFP